MKRLPIFLLSLTLLTLTAGYFELKIFPTLKEKKRYYLIDASGSYRPYLKEAFPRIASHILEDKNDVTAIAFSDRAVAVDRDELRVYEGFKRILELSSNKTDLKKALELIAVTDEHDVELILISDGNFYDINSIKGFLREKAWGLYSVLLQKEGFNDLKIVDYLAGKNSVTLSVASTSECHAEVKLGQLDIDDILTKQVRFRRGITRFTLDTKKPGFYTIYIDPVDINDPFEENNAISVEVGPDQQTRALLLSGNQGAESFFNSALGSGSFDTGYIEGRLYDLIILDNYRLKDVDEANLIKEMVYGGATLMVFGGPNSYFGGNYHTHNLQDVLPCYVTPKEQQDIILIIDNSGSMQAKYKGRQKIKYFEEVVKSVGDFLSENSLVTVLLFKDRPELVIKDQRLDNADFQGLKIDTRGATNIGDAIKFVSQVYSKEELLSRKLILFSDMETMEDVGDIRTAVKGLNNQVLVVVPGDRKKLNEKFIGIDDFIIKSVDDEWLGESEFKASTDDEVVFFNAELSIGVEGLAFYRLNGLSVKSSGKLLAKSGSYPLIIAGSYGSGRVVCSSFSLSRDWSEVDSGLLRLVGNIVDLKGSLEKEDLQIDYEYVSPDLVKVTLLYGYEKPVDVVSVDAFCPQLDRNVTFIRKGFYHFDVEIPFMDLESIHFVIDGDKYPLKLLYPDEYRRTMIDVNALSELAKSTGGRLISEAELAGMLEKEGIVLVSSVKVSLILSGLFFLLSVITGFYR